MSTPLNSGFDAVLRENKIVVCAGSGGVGKTTIAAALGVRAAQLGLRALVLTVDPARRLATALGLELKDSTDHQVPLTNVPGTLAAAVIDSRAVLDGFVRTHAQAPEIVERIMKNRLYQQLTSTLAGSQEFTALERLLQASESGAYDLVILDTPPTKHAVDFLTAPRRINALFQESVTRWFMSPGSVAGAGFIANLVSRGTRVALKSLEALTGGPFIEELIDFFASIRSIQKVLRARSLAAEQLLLGEKTRFIVVTSFDAAKLAEAKYLRSELSRLGYRLQGVVINRAFPIGVHDEAAGDAGSNEAEQRVATFYREFKAYYASRYELYASLESSLGGGTALVRVPDYEKDVHGLEDLQALAQLIGADKA